MVPIASGESHYNLLKKKEYSTGIRVTKAIAKSVVSYTNYRRHQNVKYQ